MPNSRDKASPTAIDLATGAATAVVSFAVLLLAAICAALIGAELVSAAAGEHHAYWGKLPVPGEAGARAIVLVALMLLFVVAMALVAHSRRDGLALPVAGGSLVLPERLVEDLVRCSLWRHPDVIGVTPSFRVLDQGLRIDARVTLRPGADAAALDPVLRGLVVDGVQQALGLRPEIRRLSLRVLQVGDLARHLRRA